MWNADGEVGCREIETEDSRSGSRKLRFARLNRETELFNDVEDVAKLEDGVIVVEGSVVRVEKVEVVKDGLDIARAEVGSVEDG